MLIKNSPIFQQKKAFYTFTGGGGGRGQGGRGVQDATRNFKTIKKINK